MSVSYIAKKPGARPIHRPAFEEVMKIGNPEFIDPGPAPVVPEWTPRQMQPTITPNGTIKFVQRVAEADIVELVDWAIGRFTDRWPNASKEGMIAYTRMTLVDPRSAAFRTENVWGIVVLEQEFWDPRPTARLKLLVSKKPSHKELIALVREMNDWALSRKAYEFQIDENTDYNLEPIGKRLGATRRRTHYILDREAMEAAHGNDA